MGLFGSAELVSGGTKDMLRALGEKPGTNRDDVFDEEV